MNMKKKKIPLFSGNRGFTYLEIIIIVAIMGVISSVVGVNFVQQLVKKREKADEANVSSAMALAKAEYDFYNLEGPIYYYFDEDHTEVVRDADEARSISTYGQSAKDLTDDQAEGIPQGKIVKVVVDGDTLRAFWVLPGDIEETEAPTTVEETTEAETTVVELPTTPETTTAAETAEEEPAEESATTEAKETTTAEETSTAAETTTETPTTTVEETTTEAEETTGSGSSPGNSSSLGEGLHELVDEGTIASYTLNTFNGKNIEPGYIVQDGSNYYLCSGYVWIASDNSLTFSEILNNNSNAFIKIDSSTSIYSEDDVNNGALQNKILPAGTLVYYDGTYWYNKWKKNTTDSSWDAIIPNNWFKVGTS